MKVLILGFTKITYMPYMSFYLNILKKNNCDIHLIYWKRDNVKDSEIDLEIKTYKYERYLEDSVPIGKKLTSFLGYRKFANAIIKQGNFDFVIILHSTPGVLLIDSLLKDFKNKYILDYRDFTYENIKIYKKIISSLVLNSKATFVSSNAFKTYLPKVKKIYTSHNIIVESLKNRKLNKKKEKFSKPIKIRYWGLIRYADTNIEIIKKLANDENFEIHFHGRSQGEAKKIKKYCIDKKINNVFFHGEYLPEERAIFALDTDIIQNAQDFDNITKFAMSNKFYDGAIFYIPQLCTRGTYMGENVEKYGLGISINLESGNLKEEIVSYLEKLKRSEFNDNCDFFINKINSEYKDGENIMGEIFGS